LPLQKDEYRALVADSIRAHAKVNLHLEVLNRRDDGYHNIFSLMASVALHDLLKLEDANLRDSEGVVDIAVAVRNGGGKHGSVTDAIPAQENLIARAATLYLERARKNGTVAFSIEKNIPAGAGLGGGSSDAAAALNLLNGRERAFPENELAGIGAAIGADVPYCLKGGFALCRGIGEIVMPVPGPLKAWVVLVNDGIHVDTASAYRSLKREAGLEAGSEQAIAATIKRIVAALSRGAAAELRGLAVNDFEGPVFRQHPEIGRIRERLLELDADVAVMTGSGSSVIGLFSEKETAERARARLADDYREVIITRFI
jgi:4-diphosphocytidyl-2-C-methyl-D-erythritol kinase